MVKSVSHTLKGGLRLHGKGLEQRACELAFIAIVFGPECVFQKMGGTSRAFLIREIRAGRLSGEPPRRAAAFILLFLAATPACSQNPIAN